jgi:hypothetical protein
MIVVNHTYRRIAGATLGALLGLVYGLVSQTINMILLPGYSFYQPPFGPWVNASLCVLGGALLGLITAWPKDGLWGTVLGSLVSAVAIGIYTLLSITLDPARISGTLVAIAFLIMPIFGFFVPLVAILRWTSSKQEEQHTDTVSIFKRLPTPLALLIVMGLIGSCSQYSEQARQVIPKMDALIKAGQQASDASSLPKALRADEVVGFLERAHGPFTLEWRRGDDLTSYAIPRPITDLPGRESGVIARFANGWTLICIFAPDNDEPSCKGL